MITSLLTETDEPILKWDTLDIFQREVEHLMEEEGYTEAYARGVVSGNTELNTFEWECLKETLTQLMKKIRDNRSALWHCEVENFGGQELWGSTTFGALTGGELLMHVLPNTDNTFYIYIVDSSILIQNFHHDSNTGKEWYRLTPITKKEAAYDN